MRQAGKQNKGLDLSGILSIRARPTKTELQLLSRLVTKAWFKVTSASQGKRNEKQYGYIDRV